MVNTVGYPHNHASIRASQSRERVNVIDITIAELIDLACMAEIIPIAFTHAFTADDLETKITIRDCLSEGIYDEDEGACLHYRYVGYFTEYSDERWYGLGQPLKSEADTTFMSTGYYGGAFPKTLDEIAEMRTKGESQ